MPTADELVRQLATPVAPTAPSPAQQLVQSLATPVAQQPSTPSFMPDAGPFQLSPDFGQRDQRADFESMFPMETEAERERRFPLDFGAPQDEYRGPYRYPGYDPSWIQQNENYLSPESIQFLRDIQENRTSVGEPAFAKMTGTTPASRVFLSTVDGLYSVTGRPFFQIANWLSKQSGWKSETLETLASSAREALPEPKSNVEAVARGVGELGGIVGGFAVHPYGAGRGAASLGGRAATNIARNAPAWLRTILGYSGSIGGVTAALAGAEALSDEPQMIPVMDGDKTIGYAFHPPPGLAEAAGQAAAAPIMFPVDAVRSIGRGYKAVQDAKTPSELQDAIGEFETVAVILGGMIEGRARQKRMSKEAREKAQEWAQKADDVYTAYQRTLPEGTIDPTARSRVQFVERPMVPMEQQITPILEAEPTLRTMNKDWLLSPAGAERFVRQNPAGAADLLRLADRGELTRKSFEGTTGVRIGQGEGKTKLSAAERQQFAGIVRDYMAGLEEARKGVQIPPMRPQLPAPPPGETGIARVPRLTDIPADRLAAEGPAYMVENMRGAAEKLAESRKNGWIKKDVFEAETGLMDLDAKGRNAFAKSVDQLLKSRPKEPKIEPWRGPREERAIDPTATGVVAVDKMTDAISKGGNPIRAFLREWLTPAGNQPKEAHRAQIFRMAEASAIGREVAYTARDFKQGFREATGRKRMTEQEQDAISQVLQFPPEQIPAVIESAVDPATGRHLIPKTLEPLIQKMRADADALSAKLIEIGAVEGELAAIVDANRGVYLHRSYQAFDDPAWGRAKMGEQNWTKFKALMRQQFPEETVPQIEARMKAILRDATEAKNGIDFMRRMMQGKNLGILKAKLSLTPEYRAFLGEYRDPILNYTRTVTKQADLIAKHQMLTDIRKAGLRDGWLAEEPNVPGLDTLIAPKGDPRFLPISGMRTTPEIAKAFKEAMTPSTLPGWMRLWMKANAAAKIAKTVGSWQTVVRNYVANTGFAVANGHLSPSLHAAGWKAFMADIGWINNKGARERFKKATEYGVVMESTLFNELRDTINDAVKGGLDAQPWKPASLRQKIGTTAGNIYRLGDEVWKLAAWEKEIRRYREAFPKNKYPQWTDEAVMRKAAENVRNTYPTYSMVGKAQKSLRRFPLMGPFISFYSESVRVFGGTIRLALEEMRNPQTRAIGQRRLVGLAGVMALPPGLGIASGLLAGVSKQQEDDIRQFLPPWSRNSDLFHFGRRPDGTFMVIDMSYTDPWSLMKNPLRSFFRGQDWQKAMVAAGQEFLDPFVSEELFSERVVDLLRNTTTSGSRVYNPDDTPENIIRDMAVHVAESLEPGTITSARRVRKGVINYVEPWGRTYDPLREAKAALSGFRVSDVSPSQGLKFKARDFNESLRNATSLQTRQLTSQGTVSERQIQSSRRQSEQRRMVSFDEMQKNVLAAHRLGMSWAEIARTLRAAGISKEMTKRLIYDRYGEYRPSRSVIRDIPRDVRRERIQAWRNTE